MKRPPLMHGADWCGQNMRGWWISEKLDGWRCLWTGSQFTTRQGNVLEAPAWFCAGLPEQPFDGELWAGRGTTHNDVARAVSTGDWGCLTFRPFDTPLAGVSIEDAQTILAVLPLPAHVRPVEYHRATSTEAVIAEMLAVVAAGGEGVMCRKPASRYCAGRQYARLFKVTPKSVQTAQGGRPCGVDL
jgi:DNA ligase 1